MAVVSDFIERRIITGMIVSTDYLRQVVRFWRDDALESAELQKIAGWCLTYFAEYACAPVRDIQSLWHDALRRGEVSNADGEFIEEILNRISREYDRVETFNAPYLYDQTVEYLRTQELRRHSEEIDILTQRGRVKEAEELAVGFIPSGFETSRGLEVNTEEGYEKVLQAFADSAQPLISYPGALGTMLNAHLTRDSFVAFLAPEKRGKTWILIDLAFRALRHKANVAFFQAGDLTESQMLRRLAIHVSRRSDREEYCKPRWKPVGDCLLNQFDTCARSDRNCTFGIYPAARPSDRLPFYDAPEDYENSTALIKLAEDNPDYQPCDSLTCGVRRPAVFLTKVPQVEPLVGPGASKSVRNFFDRYKRRFRLATYASDTLTAMEMQSCLAEWERQDDFVADVIIVDYADLMSAPVNEFRHRQDAIWKGLRGISQKQHALLITATQADADSYKATRLKLSNFSEDKRKYAHVTAMWGLNQTPDGREKELGLLRINELVVREGAYNATNEVVVLQDLSIGRPVLESYRGFAG